MRPPIAEPFCDNPYRLCDATPSWTYRSRNQQPPMGAVLDIENGCKAHSLVERCRGRIERPKMQHLEVSRRVIQ
jgi:hypothetical protein